MKQNKLRFGKAKLILLADYFKNKFMKDFMKTTKNFLLQEEF